MGDNLPQHSTTTIMRGNRKRPNSKPEGRRPDRGSEKPYETGLAYLLMWAHCRIQTSCGFSNSRIPSNGQRAPLIARVCWSRSYLVSLRLRPSEHGMAGNTTYCWLG